MSSDGEASGGSSGRVAGAADASPYQLEDVWAVVVNWNGGPENQSCLAALIEAGLLAERIVFVDNASRDGSLEAVERAFPSLSFVRNQSNLGFGEGANRGARAALDAGARAVFFVNNDLRVEAGSVQLLLEALSSESSLGVVGPRVLLDDGSGRLWCAGGRLDHRQNLSTLLGHRQKDAASFQRSFDVDYVAGCAMLVRRELFEAIGLLRADYFAYMEDVEFCLRARRAGFAVRTIGQALAWHAPSSATGGGYNPRRKFMQGVNSVHFLREYGGPREWLRFLFFDVLSLAPALLVAPLRGRTKGVLAKASGICAGLAGHKVSGAELEPGGRWLW